MKFLYLLLALPLLAAAAPAPVPSYYRAAKRDADSVLAKRQLTVAELKRRADYDDKDKEKEKEKEKEKKGHHSGYYYARATQAA